MFNIKPITKWYRIVKDKEGNITSKSFNHFEHGHVQGNYPQPFKPEYSNQVAWQKETWEKVHGYAKVGADHHRPYIKLLKEEG